MRLSLARIEAAASEISPEFTQTPQYECEPLSESLGTSVVLKVETLNPIGCFKGRGTDIAIDRAVASGAKSIVCASVGNLGQAVAYACRSRGIPSIIIAAESANPIKLDRIRSLGASVQTVPGDIEDAREKARQLADTEGHTRIEDSENIGTCEGAGTIALELLELNESLDAVLVALGGGAMATGIGCVMKQMSPVTKVICVQPAGAPAMTRSWRAKRVVHTEDINTIADGVAGRHPIPEVLTDLLEVADDAVLVGELSIVEGMRRLHNHARLIVEPSAALGIAAILENPSMFEGQRVASIICGANIATNHLATLFG